MNPTLKASNLDYKTSTGLGETDSALGGQKQNFACTKTQGKRAVTPQETEPDLAARVSCGGVGQQGLTTGTWGLAAVIWDGPLWH